jgi:hypothetical protein
VTVRQRGDAVVESRQAERVVHRAPVDRGRRPAERDVFGDGCVEDENVLRHVGDGGSPRAPVAVVERDAVDHYLPGFRRQQPGENVEQRGLARAVGTDHAHGGPGRNAQ